MQKQQVKAMEQMGQLSQREREVANLVLQGKGNKQIAWLLGISVSTVEFHLKNIYAKLHLSSRVELILKLGNTTGHVTTEGLGYSIVAKAEEGDHNVGKNTQLNRAAFFRKNASKNGIGSKVKNLLMPKHVLMAITTVLFSGFFWGTVFAILMGKAAP